QLPTPYREMVLWLRFASLRGGRHGARRSHGLGRRWRAQLFDLNTLFAPPIAPHDIASKHQAAFFNRHELAIKERLSGIDHVGQFDRSSFDHCCPATWRAK